MKTVTIDVALSNVNKYLINDVFTPFFVVVDDGSEYANIVDVFGTLAQVRTSECCANVDAFPNFDTLYKALIDAQRNTLLLGFGDSVSLSGKTIEIGRLKDMTFRSKIIVVCRNARKAVQDFCTSDKKFGTARRACFLKAAASYEVTTILSSLSVASENGFQPLLTRIENGASGDLFVKTSLRLKNIKKEVGSAYGAILLTKPLFSVNEECLSGTQWADYLSEPKLDGCDLLDWRSFLKEKLESSSTNKYFKYVVESATNYDVYKKRIFNALLDFAPEDKCFLTMYNERKILLKEGNNYDAAEYIAETKVKDDARIYYLTDNTVAERQAIIKSLNGVSSIPEKLKDIYPALVEYLYDYHFTGPIGELLSDYFCAYKRQKLTNRLSPEFHDKVLSFAVDGSRPYNKLKTRGEVLDTLNKDKTALYWIDALGAEYIGYIQCRAKVLDLKITVHTVKANLPTITSWNRDFYEYWSGPKYQTKKLDEIKHNGEQGLNYETTKLPIHLVEELKIIDIFFDWAKSELNGKTVDKVILVSDHGASRLAVINEQECMWEMASKGQHSGRCCLSNEADVKSKYATEENGFWVLANYDRFKGGRKASVEAHGGASIEEVVIPLIEIELFDNKITVTNTTPTTVASFRKNAEIILFSISVLRNVTVVVNGKRYSTQALENQKHKAVFEDIKDAGKYTADIFEGDNLISQIEFEVQRESGRTNDSDWFN